MEERLGPSNREDIRQVNHDLGDLIQEMHAGKQNVGLLFSIGQKLATLTQHEEIPASIKLKLSAALQDIQNESVNELDISKIVDAKKEIDAALKEKSFLD